jgi:membrane associated rhomboid family serine protease
MFGVTTSDDYKPVAWMGRYPIHVTTLLVVVHASLMVLTCFALAFGPPSALNSLMFDSDQAVHAGRVWQLFTYAFLHVPYSGSALLWFAVEMYMLFVFGREVERFIGRNAFIALYALLIFTPSVLLAIWGLWQRTAIVGSATLHFGIFVAFAAIYPQAELLFRITAKWCAIILAGIGTLGALAGRDWSSIAILWTSIGVAFVFVRLRGIGPELVWWDNLMARLQPKPKFKIVQKPITRVSTEPENVHESIDPILEKISRHGIGSLSANEKKILDRARARLLKKSQ